MKKGFKNISTATHGGMSSVDNVPQRLMSHGVTRLWATCGVLEQWNQLLVK